MRMMRFLWFWLALGCGALSPVLLQAHEGPPHDDAPRPATQPVGASVAELLALARQMNPERAAAALEADAAIARAQGAGTLPDPQFQYLMDTITKNHNGLPGRLAVEKYELQQTLPWWGKRALQQGMAEAESQEAQDKLADVEAEIALRIKTAYADYHRVHLSMDQTAELRQIMRTLVQFAQFRYAQGMATQLEATAAEAERGALDVEQVRLGKERGRIRSRLNALVNRKPDAPVVEHPQLRPLPPPATLDYATLLQRAQAQNPALAMLEARTQAAQQDHQLSGKAWYPDVSVSLGLVQNRNAGEDNGFEAMVALNIPVQWEARRAKERETAAKLKAVQAQQASEQLRIDAALQETLLSLEEAREVAQLTQNTLLPQARIALQSALQGYQTGTTEAVAVLDAVQRLKRFQIDLLKAQFEAQVRLAEIERLIGDDL
ncbi:MAG: TolC family protein [Magnetococcales bacterium]|nr:TolC family protein [Magnetococcales bacterium]